MRVVRDRGGGLGVSVDGDEPTGWRPVLGGDVWVPLMGDPVHNVKWAASRAQQSFVAGEASLAVLSAKAVYLSAAS